MIKTYILASYSILIFLFGWLVKPIEISMQAPTEIVAGVPFDVEIIINKGDLDGFARFQQRLPDGFTAELIDAETGTFEFAEQTIKFFWLIIPNKDEIRLKYSIITDMNISGDYSIDGIFSYIDGEKKYIEMPLYNITITPSPLAQSIQDTAKVNMETIPQITCERQSVKINESGEIEIEILVNRGDLDAEQFAKIQENVPKGYDAKSIETKGGIFTFQNNTAKFLWMTMPGEQEYVVSYKLIPNENTNLAQLEVTGNFSYLVNGQTVEIPLSDGDKSVAQMVDEQLAYRQGDIKVEEADIIAENLVEEDSNNAGIEEEVIAQNTEEAEIVEEEEQTEEQIEVVAEEVITVNNDTKQITPVEMPSTDVSYRVQVAAGHNRIQPRPYFTKLKLKESVSIETMEGWYKYTVGGYNEYLQARNKRNNIWDNTPIKDAFVTAYNSGQRITVQEALMISNQKWYQ